MQTHKEMECFCLDIYWNIGCIMSDMKEHFIKQVKTWILGLSLTMLVLMAMPHLVSVSTSMLLRNQPTQNSNEKVLKTYSLYKWYLNFLTFKQQLFHFLVWRYQTKNYFVNHRPTIYIIPLANIYNFKNEKMKTISKIKSL